MRIVIVLMMKEETIPMNCQVDSLNRLVKDDTSNSTHDIMSQ
jgi:hypothetical protein